MGDTIVRLPSYTVEATYLASEFKDLVGWGLKSAKVPDAWKHTRGAFAGRRVRVAVCDTGCDRVHYERGDLQNVTHLEDVTRTGPFCVGSDCHGAHVLGIVGAEADDYGIQGVAPDCELVSIKCMVDGSGAGSWVARSIDMARDLQCHIVSLSLGSPEPDPNIAAAVERFVAGGGFVVAAAGNTGRMNDVNYPARWSAPHGRPHLDAIAVAALDRDGRLAPYSSRGPEVDFAAPGSEITSCWRDGGYATLQGTSMATPLVAGVVALLIARHWQLGDASATPLRTMAELRDHLKGAVVDLGATGHDHGTGWGMIDAERLLGQEMPLPPQPPIGEPVSDVIFRWGNVEVHAPARAGDAIGISGLKL